tara:strand:- start:16683 stop:19424 length:2742 start_codon:yes stop_codon:yes gene_type:complete
MAFSKLINSVILLFLGVFTNIVVVSQVIEMPKEIAFGELENGLTYYIIPNGERGKIRLTMLSNTGALAESKNEHGLAHVLEHMMFKGSKNYPGNTSYKVMDGMGMRISKEMSAFTSGLHTEFNLYIPEKNEVYMRKSFLLFKDWMFNLRIKKKALDTEKKVIIEEINRGGTPASPYLNGTMLEGHDVLGSKEAINSVTVDKINSFYKKNYTPNQLAILIYGKVDKNKAIELVKEIFGKVTAKEENKSHKYPNLSDKTVIDRTYYRKSKKKEKLLIIASKRKVLPINTYKKFKQHLVNILFGKMLENRLKYQGNKELSQSKVRVSNMLSGNQFTNFRLKTSKNITYENLLDIFCSVIAQTKKYGFTKEEIEYYVSDFIARLEKSKNDTHVTYSEVEKHFLTGNIPLSGKMKYEFSKKWLSTLKSEDFMPLLTNFINDHKTILFDSTSTAYTSRFDKSYIIDKINSIERLKVFQNKINIPAKRNVVKPKFINYKLNIDPTVKIVERILLANNLVLLKYKNGVRVILDNYPQKQTLIKLVGKGGLNSIPINDRIDFKKQLRFLFGSYGEYSTKEVSAVERSLNVFKKISIQNFGYEYELKGNPEYFEELLKLFNLSIIKAVPPNVTRFNNRFKQHKTSTGNGYSSFVDSLNLKTVFNKKGTVHNTEKIARFFRYNQLLKTNLSQSIVYIKGNLPINIETLVSKYIASIPISKVDNLSNLRSKKVLAKCIFMKEFYWKRPVSILNYLFTAIPNKQQTFKDELILEAIALYAEIIMLKTLREKYGLVYSTGTTATIKNSPFYFKSLSFRYMISPLQIEESRKIMENEVLKPLSKGQITPLKVKQLKAMLKSVYITSFYDNKQIDEAWLQQSLKYNRVLSPKLIKETIEAITINDLETAMKNVINKKKHFVLIRKPSTK